MDGPPSTTIELSSQERLVMPEMQLVIAGPSDLTTVPLLSGREYVIGRGPQAHIRLNDQAASRAHARLVINDQGVQLEDLDSGNGTLVAGARLSPGKPHPLRPGDGVTIGATSLMLQRLVSSPQRRRVWSHVYFLGRLEEECFKAPELGSPFTITRLRFPDEHAEAQVATILSPILSPFDLIARYGARDWELLLPGLDRVAADGLMKRVRGQLEAKASEIRIGLAVYGADGRDPAALLSSALRDLQGAGSGMSPASSPLILAGPRMQGVLRLVERAAAARSESANILILGETGVGKTVLARWVHEQSPRKGGPFIRVDLGALTKSLIESELFGHKKGSFTDATSDKIGLLEQAQGGTLHLDEIGELSPELQLKLLTALQEREVRRIGEANPRRIDVRVIASTNRDLRADMASGRFRSDLYYRLAVFVVALPPLRARSSEIEPLVRSFLSRVVQEEKLHVAPELSERALAAIEGYEWPGNVRELENAVRRAVVLCSSGVIEPDDLGLAEANHDLESETEVGGDDPDLEGLDGEQLKERRRILGLLAEHQWVVERAAKADDLGKTAFYRKLRRLRIPLKARATPR